MLPQDNLAAYRELASRTRLPLTIGERLMTRWGFRELIDNGAASIIMPGPMLVWRALGGQENRVVGARCCIARRLIWRPT